MAKWTGPSTLVARRSGGDRRATSGRRRQPARSEAARPGRHARRAAWHTSAFARRRAYLTLHSAADDFHASIPLAAVRDRRCLIYRLDGAPLPAKAGGPVRFLIPDHAACHTAEIDECANVKFVDHIELSVERGHDNRPQDEAGPCPAARARGPRHASRLNCAWPFVERGQAPRGKAF